jgi:hypothetical protein
MVIGAVRDLAAGVQCCFCGQRISDETPLHILLDLPQGASQELWSHGSCFGSKLDPSVPFLTPDEHLEP